MSRGISLLLVFSGLLYSASPSSYNYPNRMRFEEYDYIIVGAGSAGSVLANRLSEDPSTTVLLLESGGFPDDVSEIPLFSPGMIGGGLDWRYKTTPQEHACLGLEEQRNAIPRGHVLGGTSTINSMLYVRGSPKDFDAWEKGGATGWSWQDVLYYFKKSEDQTDPTYLENWYHSTGGYLTVSSNTHATPIRDAFLEAGQHMGYQINDINGRNFKGFSPAQSTTRNGLRCSTEKAFLRPAAHRDNLDILVNAHVIKVDIDDQKSVKGVQFERNNATHIVTVKKEVIVSAGAIASPQILMLSGIGPKKHLEELGIEVVADLPVGENLQDHLQVGGLVYLLNSTVSIIESRDITREAIGAILKGTGLMSIACGVEVLAFVDTEMQDPSENYPDVALYVLSSLFLPVMDENVEPFLSNDAVTIFPMIARPKSRGTIRLASRNPLDHPLIDPQYLKEEFDLNTLVGGMKFVEKLMQSPSMQRFGAKRIPMKIERCEKIDPASDEYLVCMARTLTSTAFHQSCTCKMGKASDPTTVVDPQLRVKGVSGLRVVDASVMPSVTSGNTNAPSIMIGEKAADMIRGRFWDPQTGEVVIRNE